jgi:hypothetical protein
MVMAFRTHSKRCSETTSYRCSAVVIHELLLEPVIDPVKSMLMRRK